MAMSVPVVVDSVKRDPAFPMTRCNYLTIQCDEPADGWTIAFEGEPLPFLMLGLTGIITSPFDGDTFEDPSQLDDLFARVERNETLYVDVDDIWLPNDLLATEPHTSLPGSVIRLGIEPFRLAYRYRDGRLGDDAFRTGIARYREEARFSAVETETLKAWHWGQIEHARSLYYARKKLGGVLPEREAPQGGGHEPA